MDTKRVKKMRNCLGEIEAMLDAVYCSGCNEAKVLFKDGSWDCPSLRADIQAERGGIVDDLKYVGLYRRIAELESENRILTRRLTEMQEKSNADLEKIRCARRDFLKLENILQEVMRGVK